MFMLPGSSITMLGDKAKADDSKDYKGGLNEDGVHECWRRLSSSNLVYDEMKIK